MIEKFINYINDKNKEYVIFDIGSRDCQQSIEFYKTFPNAKIYAFECNPNTLHLCEQNIIPYQDRITLIKGAVCDYDGSITFYPINQEKTKTTWKDGNPGASSLFKSNGKYTIETYVQDEITTNCHRLDTIMNKHNIPCVDIIWMDLQGAELLALKGLGNKLSSVEYLYTEVSHKEMYTGQVMYKELNDYMIKNNFSILNKLRLSGWQEDVVYKKKSEHMNSITINNYKVIIDCFFSPKYNSLVVITNNRTNIFKKTGINISDIKFKLNNEIIELYSIDVKDFIHLDGHNHKKGVFKENFHIDVLCKKFTFNDSKNSLLDIIINDNVYTFNLNPPNLKFINSKCLTTIFKDEYYRINEWVNYHKQIGFEFFILYDNNSKKKENINIENVEIISANWDYWQPSSNKQSSSIGQVIQQNHCLWKYSPSILGLTDLDEFINVHNFDIFNFKDSVISIPNYFFNYNTNIYDSLYREKDKNDMSTDRRKCIIKSKEVDLFCVHIPISFKNIYYCKYNEVQLNHYLNLSTKRRNKMEEVVYDDSILNRCQSDLIKYEKKIYSQNGEDGITLEIIKRLNIENGFYVEFETQNGSECNTRILREKYNWKGLLMDGSHQNDNINLKKEFITRENILTLFNKYNVPKNFNLLSIDIDFNDFYVLHKILQNYSMDIIILEYNAYFHPNEDSIIKYDPNGGWDGTNYFGASLLSYTKLLNKFDYSLIYTEKKGVNAFFVKNIYNSLFKYSNNLSILYNSAIYGSGPRGSHTKDKKLRKYVSFNDIVSSFDIVIPVGPNDKSVIEQQIKHTQKNIIGYRNIYLICYDPSITIDGCITINENIFPFNINTVAEHHGKLKQNGWYLQQLLKLYAGKIIPDILDKYLVIDADTFFLKPTTFEENNKCLYNYSTEYHKTYFHHMQKLDKDLTKIDKNKSGICHHMIFEKKYINELISKIEKNHNELFYNIFLKTVTNKNGSGASEYEIYFNYMLKYNPDKIQIRKLRWENMKKPKTNSNYDYISCHWYMR